MREKLKQLKHSYSVYVKAVESKALTNSHAASKLKSEHTNNWPQSLNIFHTTTTS
jgi:hypothetical protein